MAKKRDIEAKMKELQAQLDALNGSATEVDETEEEATQKPVAKRPAAKKATKPAKPVKKPKRQPEPEDEYDEDYEEEDYDEPESEEPAPAPAPKPKKPVVDAAEPEEVTPKAKKPAPAPTPKAPEPTPVQEEPEEEPEAEEATEDDSLMERLARVKPVAVSMHPDGPGEAYAYWDYKRRFECLTTSFWVATQASDRWRVLNVWYQDGMIHHVMDTTEMQRYLP